MFKLLFLSFIGPFYFVILEALFKIMMVATSFMFLIRGKKGYDCVRNCFMNIIENIFHVNEEQIDGLNKQRQVV